MKQEALNILKDFGDDGMLLETLKTYVPYISDSSKSFWDKFKSSILLKAKVLPDDTVMIKLENIDTWVSVEVIPNPYRYLVYNAVITMAHRGYGTQLNTETNTKIIDINNK